MSSRTEYHNVIAVDTYAHASTKIPSVHGFYLYYAVKTAYVVQTQHLRIRLDEEGIACPTSDELPKPDHENVSAQNLALSPLATYPIFSVFDF